MGKETTLDRSPPPEPYPIDAERIPDTLKVVPQWVCWRYVDRGAGKKPDKQPVNPHTLGNAGVHWPNTWSGFAAAYATHKRHRLAGIGFVLTHKDPFVGVDLDHCLRAGELTAQAQTTVAALNSYTEVSPSGTGLRIMVACSEFAHNRRTPQVEGYAHSRFVTLTGHHWLGTPETISAVPATLLTALFPHKDAPTVIERAPTRATTFSASDQEIWQRIFTHDRYGAEHARRFAGDTSLDGDDHSLTVIRLVNCLARWTQGDAGRMRTLMLQSPLMNDKWFRRRGSGDWLDLQIADAISFMRRER